MDDERTGSARRRRRRRKRRGEGRQSRWRNGWVEREGGWRDVGMRGKGRG